MGQVLLKDKIGSLSESGGIITLASSVLTIGGRQYTTNSLIVAADLTSANTRYQIYAVQSAGVVSLVVSQNENSVGPVGSSSHKLVGAYQTNGMGSIGLGAFISITGSALISSVPYLPSFSHQSGAATNFDIVGAYWIDGNRIKIEGKVIFTGAVGTWVQAYISQPTNITPANNRVHQGSSTSLNSGSTWHQGTATIIGTNFWLVLLGTDLTYSQAENITNVIPFTWVSGDVLEFRVEYEIDEGLTIPIEDL